MVIQSQSSSKLVFVGVGINRYDDSAISELHFAVNDVNQLGDHFSRQKWEVIKLTTSRGVPHAITYPTKVNIEKLFRDLAKRSTPIETLLFFFAGHGFSEGSDNYLAPSDTRLGDLKRTGISLHELQEWTSSVKCTHVLIILDACRSVSGRAAASDQPPALSPAFERNLSVLSRQVAGSVIISACRQGERALEDPRYQHGLFTYCLLQGLRGQGLANQAGPVLNPSGEITLLSMCDYLLKSVPEISGRVQTPYIAYEGSAQIVLAKVSGGIRTQRTVPTLPSVSLEFRPASALRTRTVDWYVDGVITKLSRNQILLQAGNYKISLSVTGLGAVQKRSSHFPIQNPFPNPVGMRYNVHFRIAVQSPRHQVRILVVPKDGRLQVSVIVDSKSFNRVQHERDLKPDTFWVEFL